MDVVLPRATEGRAAGHNRPAGSPLPRSSSISPQRLTRNVEVSRRITRNPPATDDLPKHLPSPIAPLADLGPIRALVHDGSEAYARGRARQLQRADPVEVQGQTLRDLVREAEKTRFGRDHRFDAIRTVADFQAAVPLRTDEDL